MLKQSQSFAQPIVLLGGQIKWLRLNYCNRYSVCSTVLNADRRKGTTRWDDDKYLCIGAETETGYLTNFRTAGCVCNCSHGPCWKCKLCGDLSQPYKFSLYIHTHTVYHSLASSEVCSKRFWTHCVVKGQFSCAYGWRLKNKMSLLLETVIYSVLSHQGCVPSFSVFFCRATW